MTNKQANILFIPTSISGYRGEPQTPLTRCDSYQQLIYSELARSKYTIEGFQVLGRRLACIARHAYLANRLDAVEEASLLLRALPISSQGIADYYQAVCTWRRGDSDSARRILERVVEESPRQYRARALQIIGLTYHQHGDVDAALPLYVAAGRIAANSDLLTLAESQQMIAVVRSVHGDHKQSLADLERLFPLLRVIRKDYPPAYYRFLNHLAVELCEVGRLGDAEATLSIALASPFVHSYPEWSATRDEIAEKQKAASPSTVAIPRSFQAKTLIQVRVECSRPARAVIIGRPASLHNFFQRASIEFPAKVLMVLNAVSILARVLLCISPRAPPLT